MRSGCLVLLALLVAATPAAAAKKVLFDNAHAETAGNADWVIDTDQPIPLPDQSTVGPATPRTYWLGAISSWGIDLVKRGYTVATNTTALTYGNAGNPYDLSKFDVLIVPEPNTLFTSAEATAILNYVRDGGGLIAVSDHDVSDRNNDGYDSPKIWNAMDPGHLLGVHFGSTGDANNNIVQTSNNVNPAASDSVTHGPEGVVTGLAFHNGTTLTLYPAVNPSVRGEVWMTGLSQTSTTGVMAASSVYGNGRVFFAGDSSPIDDGSAAPGNSNIYDGWGEANGADSVLFMNATHWVARRPVVSDPTPPVASLTSPDGGEVWKAGSSHAVTWSASDNIGVTSVDLAYSTNGGSSFPNTIATGLANSGIYSWTVPNAPGTTVRVRVRARDAAGNLAADSSAANFTIDLWTIQASAGANGSISPIGTISLAQGASQSFTIAAAACYQIADVVVDGGSKGAVSGYTFSNVAANHTISATFAPDSYTLSIGVTGTGTVSRSPDQPSYACGSGVELSAMPGAGWAFVGWSGDTTDTTNPLSLVLGRDMSLIATFADVQPPLVLLTAPVGGEQWPEASLQNVTWTASDNAVVDSVNVDYSLTGAAGPWFTLAHGLANSGSVAWTLPSQASDSALVRVTGFDHALNAGSATSDSLFHIVNPNLAVGEGGPGVLTLACPQPNPSSAAAELRFSLPQAGRARLEILDLAGRSVWVRAGDLPAGWQAWRWDGSTTAGTRAGAGLYFVRLETPWGNRTERLARLR